jgi:hypothetical protein
MTDLTLAERAQAVDKLSKMWAATVAGHLAETGVNNEALSRMMSSISGVPNTLVMLFMSAALKAIADDVAADEDRPEEFSEDLVLPVIAATITHLASHMKVLTIPATDPKDLN